MPFPTYISTAVFGNQAPSPIFWDEQKELRIPAGHVPALAGSLVQLELQLRPQSVDLEAVTRVVRGDLGLCLQVLRQAREGMEPSDELWRLSDCVINLGPQMLEIAPPLCSWSEDRKVAYAEAEAFWRHAKLVATVAEKTAAYFTEFGVNPEQAYLAGLLHNLKKLPQVIGSVAAPGYGEESSTIQEWIASCNLPDFLMEVIDTCQDDRVPANLSDLARIVSFARRWIDLCLPWSETCLAKKARFTMPVLQAANLIYKYFPGTEVDPFVPFVEILRDSTLEKLDDERSMATAVIPQAPPLENRFFQGL